MNKYSLDIDKPEELPAVLRYAAAAYLHSAADLRAVWSDDEAGAVWVSIADILAKAAQQITALAPRAKYQKEE